MSSIPRPITTSNSRQEKHQFHRMDAEPSVELDEDYFEALKRIEYVRQNPKPPDPELPKKRKRFRFSFSARLTLAGQEAMVKAYEDTLVASLKDIYSSEKFNSIIPRSTLSTVPKKPLQVIREAQILLEKINQKSMHKHDLFEAYLRWQEKLKNSSSIELDSII